LRQSAAMRSSSIEIIVVINRCTDRTEEVDRGLGYFVLHPMEFIKLLGGRERKLADKVWYDFKRY
jgi:hypothetical protein